MNRLYYGQGECSIVGNANYIRIVYKGAIEIRGVTSNDYYIFASDKAIAITSIKKPTNSLGLLFKYKGEFKIISATTLMDGEIVPTTIKKVMNYSELLTSNAEDLTVKSEDLKAVYQYGGRINKTRLLKKTITGLYTGDEGSPTLLLDGEIYSGYYNRNVVTGEVKTGAKHTPESKELKITIVGRK